jgi:hypothetical protein
MPSYRTRTTLRRWVISVDKDVRRELRQVVQNTAQELKDYLTGVTAKWEHKPKFRRVMVVRPTLIRASVQAVGKNSDIFGYVDRGTGKYGARGAAYKIKPVNAPALKFRAGYDARSRPSDGPGSAPRANVGTGKAIGGWVTTKEVTHPGIRPRKFAETFEQKLQPNFRRRVSNAIRRAARRN